MPINNDYFSNISPAMLKDAGIARIADKINAIQTAVANNKITLTPEQTAILKNAQKAIDRLSETPTSQSDDSKSPSGSQSKSSSDSQSNDPESSSDSQSNGSSGSQSNGSSDSQSNDPESSSDSQSNGSSGSQSNGSSGSQSNGSSGSQSKSSDEEDDPLFGPDNASYIIRSLTDKQNEIKFTSQTSSTISTTIVNSLGALADYLSTHSNLIVTSSELRTQLEALLSSANDLLGPSITESYTKSALTESSINWDDYFSGKLDVSELPTKDTLSSDTLTELADYIDDVFASCLGIKKESPTKLTAKTAELDAKYKSARVRAEINNALIKDDLTNAGSTYSNGKINRNSNGKINCNSPKSIAKVSAADLTPLIAEIRTALMDQIRYSLQKVKTHAALDRHYVGAATSLKDTPAVAGTVTRMAKDTNCPSFWIYLDASGSWGISDYKPAYNLIASLQDLADKGLLNLKLKYFGMGIADDHDTAKYGGEGSTSSMYAENWAAVAKDVAKNNVSNVMIITDDNPGFSQLSSIYAPIKVAGRAWLVLATNHSNDYDTPVSYVTKTLPFVDPKNLPTTMEIMYNNLQAAKGVTVYYLE